MGMKKRFLIAAALVLTLSCGIAIGASASGYVDITASLAYPISIKYNGEIQVMKDASGNQVYPITYQGTTYVPIRAVSNMLGIAVDWDQETQSVLLGETPEPETPGIVFYEEFPEVPDFGEFVGVSPLRAPYISTDGSGLYSYLRTDVATAMESNPNCIKDYGDLLISQDFQFSGGLDGNEYGMDDVLVLYFKKNNMTVGVGWMNSDNFDIYISFD